MADDDPVARFSRPAWAQTYEDVMVPAMFRPWAEQLLQRCPVRPGDRVVDVACGTGAVSRLAADAAGPGRVTGVDLAPPMLDVARAADPHNRIDWRLGPADALPVGDAEADVVLCQFGLMFFPDRPAALAEMARVLKPGGRVGIATWQALELNPVLRAQHDAADAVGWTDVTGLTRVGFSLGDPAELRALAEGAGFTDVTVEQVAMALRWPPPTELVQLQRRPPEETTEEEQERYATDVLQRLAPYEDHNGMTAPSAALLTTASRRV